MIALVVTAAVFLASPPADTQPLREIVYKFSFDRMTTRTLEEFGAAPDAATSNGGYSGTLTIDVKTVGDDGSILIEATETTNATNAKKPNRADFVVHPDGSLVIVAGTYDDSMTTLLPYFATKFFGDHDLQLGASWEMNSIADKVQSTSKFTVSSIAGDSATIAIETQAKGGNLPGPLSVEAKLEYKASLLVPLSLDVVIINSGQSVASSANAQSHYHFARVSDTRDSGK